MDFEYTPEQEAFRVEVREWLETNLPPDLCIDDPMDERIAPNREVFEKRRDWQTNTRRGRMGRTLMAQRIRRPRRRAYGADHLRRRIFPRACADPAWLLGSRTTRSHPDAMGFRGTEEEVPAANPARRRHLVPGLLGTRCRLRPRKPPDPGGIKG